MPSASQFTVMCDMKLHLCAWMDARPLTFRYNLTSYESDFDARILSASVRMMSAAATIAAAGCEP